MAHMSK